MHTSLLLSIMLMGGAGLGAFAYLSGVPGPQAAVNAGARGSAPAHAATTPGVAVAPVADPKAIEAVWLTDIAAAKAEALKTGADILMDFTGSDWCPDCMHLEEEVFGQPGFAAWVKGKFVLLRLDTPRGFSLPEDQQKQVDDLKLRYNVSGFPTVLLADDKGRAFALTTYMPIGLEAYLQHLDELRGEKTTRDKSLALAHKAQGAEQAKLLDETLEALGRELGNLEGYENVIDETIAADGAGPLAAKWRARKGLPAKLHAMDDAMEHQDTAKALRIVEEALAVEGLEPASHQVLLFRRGAIRYQMGEQDKVLTDLKEAEAVAPETRLAAQIRQMIRGLSGQ